MDQLLSTPREALYWEYQNVTVPALALENILVGDLCVFDMFDDDAGTSPVSTFDANHPFNRVRRKGASAYTNYDATRIMAGVYCLAPIPNDEVNLETGPTANSAPVVVRAGEVAQFILQGIGIVAHGIQFQFGRWGVVSAANFAIVDRMQNAGGPLFCVAQSLTFRAATTPPQENFDLSWCRFDGLYGFGTTATSYT